MRHGQRPVRGAKRHLHSDSGLHSDTGLHPDGGMYIQTCAVVTPATVLMLEYYLIGIVEVANYSITAKINTGR